MRGLHSPACATGARAETRGPCDCGAGEMPYRARMLDDVDDRGQRLVEIEIDGALTTSEVVMMSIMLQELTREEGQRWARSKQKKLTPRVAP